jgi:hypothetical protein
MHRLCWFVVNGRVEEGDAAPDDEDNEKGAKLSLIDHMHGQSRLKGRKSPLYYFRATGY